MRWDKDGCALLDEAAKRMISSTLEALYGFFTIVILIVR